MTGADSASTALPTAPDGPTLADVMESAAAAAGLESASNRLGIPAHRRVVVVVIDGLGSSILKRYGAHAPFLKSQAGRSRRIRTVFPTTTASALTSLSTGVLSGEHGIVGYDVLDPEHPKGPRVVNQLGQWDPSVDPKDWQRVPSILERCEAAGMAAFTVSQKRFATSGLTKASMSGGEFLVADSSDARVTVTVQTLKQNARAFVYAYWNELDKAGHVYGVDSPQYVRALEDIDFALKRLASQAPADTLLLITADHGMIDVAPAQRIDYSEHAELLEHVAFTAGEPRLVQLHWTPESTRAQREDTIAAWRAFLGTRAWVGERDEVIEAGWFGPVTERNAARIGDLIIACRTPIALYDGRRVSPRAFEMVGQHGSITPEELTVPLFVLPTA